MPHVHQAESQRLPIMKQTKKVEILEIVKYIHVLYMSDLGFPESYIWQTSCDLTTSVAQEEVTAAYLRDDSMTTMITSTKDDIRDKQTSNSRIFSLVLHQNPGNPSISAWWHAKQAKKMPTYLFDTRDQIGKEAPAYLKLLGQKSYTINSGKILNMHVGRILCTIKFFGK